MDKTAQGCAGCAGCQSSCGGCGGCPGCGGQYSLTQEEIEFLSEFAVIPFLPAARKADGDMPVYLEHGGDIQKNSETLMWLKLKGLISIDYDLPIKNYDYSIYKGYPVRGSMALTASGQAVLEALDIQGAEQG